MGAYTAETQRIYLWYLWRRVLPRGSHQAHTVDARAGMSMERAVHGTRGARRAPEAARVSTGERVSVGGAHVVIQRSRPTSLTHISKG